MKKAHIVLKIIFSFFMFFSAIGELTLNETVVHSLDILQMPTYLLYLLGILKILGIITIWLSPIEWLMEWAYAGFTFDFLGAIFGFIATRQLLFPDVIMAPLAMILCLLTYFSWKKRK